MRIRIEEWETVETRESMRRMNPRTEAPRDRSRTQQAKRKTVARKRQRKVFAHA